MKRFLSILCILCLLLGMLPNMAFAAPPNRPGDDDDDDSGSGDASGVLSIVVPSGVSITLKNAWAGTGSTVSASSTSTSGGYKTYTYNGLATGSYSFVTSGSGYNTLTKDVYFESGTQQTITKDPGKKNGNGWEQGSGIERTEQLIADGGLFASQTTSFPGYEYVFNTPTFTDSSIGKQQFTPHSTMIAFLKALVEDCPNAYYYKVGSSPSYGYEFPVVVFTKTDLSGKTMEEAGALVQANGKPTVMHQAQVHGNEPAPGEGSLALAYAAATGNLTDYNGGDILDSVNILIYPRINADGAYKFQRNNVKDGLNMNRGYLHMRSSEIQDVVSVYNAFLPEIVMDAHEWTPDNTGESNSYFDDLWLFCNGSTNNSKDMLNGSIDIMENVFADAEKIGIRPFFYTGNMNYTASEGTANSLAPYYYGMRGSYAFCVETRGIGIGRGCYERRVVSHYLTAESMIRYAAANAKEIVESCAAERERIAQAGSVFSSDNTITLKHTNTTHTKAYPRPTLNLLTNTITNPDATQKPTAAYTASRTRTRPTAYLLKAGTSGLSTVLKTMDYHNIPYIKLTESITVTVKSYSGSTSSASLSSAKTVTFEAGSYLFPMNHGEGNILAMIMEPDVYDSSASESYSTFVQRGILSIGSIYRFEGNVDTLLEKPEAPTGLSVVQPTYEVATGTITGLDAEKVYEYRAEGSSVYTAVAEGSTEISGLQPGTYYVRFAAVDGSQPSDEVQLVVDLQPQLPKYTVTFYGTEGNILVALRVTQGDTAEYTGTVPTKAYTEEFHYTFNGWVDAEGNPAALENINADADFYPSFAESAHEYESSTLIEPTCTVMGTILHACTGCDRSYKTTVEALGHSTELRNATAATCSATGYSGDLFCTTCNTVVEYGAVLPTTDHAEEIIPGQAATCLNSGLTDGKRCSTCGVILVQQEAIGRLGHNYVCTDLGNGTHAEICSRCDKTKTAQVHTPDENGVCTLCGNGAPTEPEPTEPEPTEPEPTEPEPTEPEPTEPEPTEPTEPEPTEPEPTEPTEPTVDESIKILHTLDLASDISISFVVPMTALSGYDLFYLECTLPKYEGNELIGTSTLTVDPVISGSYYYFTLTGFTAVNMGDMVQAVLHMSKDGAEYISLTDHYSVATYAYGMFGNTTNEKILTLCADLLRYGAEAQRYKGYRTDAPVDAAMTEEQRAYLSDIEAVSFEATDSNLGDVEIPEITWVGKTLDLGSKVGVKFVFHAGSHDVSTLSMRVSYTDGDGERKTVVLTDAEVYNANLKYYSFTFYGLLAAELRTAVDVAIYEGEIQRSETIRYSAETYASKTMGTALAPLCKALFAYSDSAKAYFTK